MAVERIDIAVTDKVDANIPKKFNQIADAADRGHNYVRRLNAAIRSINSSSVDRLASAMAKADAAQAKLMNAQARLTNAQNQGSAAAAKLALTQQRTATEAARTEAAHSRAAAATSAAAAADLRLQAAQQRLAATSVAAATGQQNLASATTRAGSAAQTSGNSFRNYVNEIQRANSAASGAVPAGQQMAQGMNQATNASGQYLRAARTTTHVNANIIAQLQDIGVSLAGGQNPLLVMIQQGSQLSYIASTLQGGMRSLLGIVLRMIAPFTGLAVAAGGLYSGFRSFSNDIAARHKPALESYANSLGLTEREMRRLQNTTVSANGQIREFDTLTVTMGDSWNGFIATVREGLAGLAGPYQGLVDMFGSAWDRVTSFMRMAFVGFYGLVVGGMRGVVRIIANLPSVAGNTAAAIANAVIAGIEWLLNKAIQGINALIDGASGLLSHFGIETRRVGEVSFDRFARSGQDAFQVIGSAVTESIHEADNTLTGFAARWEDNAVDAARNRIRTAADASIENRNPGAAGRGDTSAQRAAERRELAIRALNTELDNELSRMGLLKDERAVQARMDQIQEQFLRRRITLTEAETATIEGKVRAIEAYRYVQSELDRIHEEAIGPERTLNATRQAAIDLLARGAITQEQFNAELVKAANAFESATNPLFEFNRAMETSERLMGLYGTQLEQANFLESIRQEYQARGLSIIDASTGALRAEVAALVARNDALRDAQYLQDQVSQFLDPALEQSRFVQNYRTIYEEINRLRSEDLQNEEIYQQALYGLQARYNEMRLSGISDLFGAIASATSQGYGVIGTISKAAAVAQATMDGYVAVQKALASLPPPFSYAAAAAVAVKTGTQVAGILSTNVGSYKDGGSFMVGGKSGVDANNINMNVTRGERVTVETAAQQRANDNGGAPVEVDARTKVVNLFDEKTFIGAMDSEEGERVVGNIIQRNPQWLNRP